MKGWQNMAKPKKAVAGHDLTLCHFSHPRICKLVFGCLLFAVGLWFHEKITGQPQNMWVSSGEACGLGTWITQGSLGFMFRNMPKDIAIHRQPTFTGLILILALFNQALCPKHCLFTRFSAYQCLGTLRKTRKY